MNLLITGSNGQLGRELQNRLSLPGSNLHFTGREQLDITEKKALENYLKDHQIDTIVNAAAYTDVDGAEKDEKTAFLINEQGPANLASLAARYGIGLIHISTDYVFNGRNHRPYLETDPPSPQGVYGKSKRAGEQKILELKAGLIIRTAWLYSPYGKNFVKTIARLVKERDALKVVYDQVGNPTHAGDLANAIGSILSSPAARELTGIYHFANEGVCSWYDFACEIARLENPACTIRPIESKDYPTPAPRPHYSVLNKQKIKDRFSIHIPWWRESLSEMLRHDG